MAESESSAAVSNCPPANTPAHQLAKTLNLARLLIKKKERTLATARRHLNDIENYTDVAPVSVAFLGDSMIERMAWTTTTETGLFPNFQAWPPETRLTEQDLTSLNRTRQEVGRKPVSRIERVANFGCGGDKIENMLYRLVGDPSESLTGLVQEIGPLGGEAVFDEKQLLWVVQAGSNNLHHKKGLTDASLNALRILLLLLHGVSPPGSRLLLTGLFYRTDIPRELIDKANIDLKNLVANLEKEIARPNSSINRADKVATTHMSEALDQLDEATDVSTPEATPPSDHEAPWDRTDGTFRFFLPTSQLKEIFGCLEDHVHLNQEGYLKWMQTLLPKVDEMLESQRKDRY
ncbi:hypothetical protein diail_4310 [Diaporthe ilicicola]|nr:hypothetical protein diail_4310 [Diaporthe ilicicola]